MSTQGGTTGVVRVRRRSRRVLDVPEGTVEVIRAGYDGNAEEVQTIRVPKFEGPVAYVRTEGSVTRNMGDYNSVRVAVMVEMPCYPVASEVDRCYRWCSDKVEEKIAEELRVALGQPREISAA